jgi:flagellar biosynthetic protein FliP
MNLFGELAHLPREISPSAIPTRVLVPAFVTSELKTAFIMGFCLYLPFLLIDLVVSVVLTALGMIMMPPVVISTPCKLLLFVLLDGWVVLLKALSLSFMSK